MSLSPELILQLQKNWNPQTLSGRACTTFGGRIQFTGSPQEGLEKLRALESFKTNPAKLAPVDDPNQNLPREVDSEPEDFVEVDYRALSAAILGDRPIDFSKEAVLKKGVRLLNGQTIFKDHDTRTDNWVGTVVATKWDTKTPGLPPGINATLRLDMVKDPMTVRGVLQGALHSVSVTVSFQWEPSHPKLMEENRFWQYLGQDFEGELVRIVVTRIEKFWEISLVWQGADEFAKQIDENGDPLNIYSREESQSLEANPGAKFHEVALTQEEEMKIQEALKKMFGKEVTDENAAELVAEYANTLSRKTAELSEAKILDLEAKVTESSTKAVELEKTVARLTPQAELGAAHLESVREEAARLYKMSKGDEAKEVILKTLKSADLEIATAWKEEFHKDVEEKFPPRCSKCNSTEISRQSSKVEDINKTEKEAALQPVGEFQGAKLRDLHS